MRFHAVKNVQNSKVESCGFCLQDGLQVIEQEHFLISTHGEVFLHCSDVNEESLYDALHGNYTVQQNNVHGTTAFDIFLQQLLSL